QQYQLWGIVRRRPSRRSETEPGMGLRPGSHRIRRRRCHLRVGSAFNRKDNAGWVQSELQFRVNQSAASSDTNGQRRAGPGRRQGWRPAACIDHVLFRRRTTPVPAGWLQVPNASASNSNDQTVVWFHFVASGDPDLYTWDWGGTKAFPSGGITVWRG